MERCLQDRTGSCLGCNILGITVKKINGGGDPAKTILDTQSSLCPEGNAIQTNHLNNPKGSMGQPNSNITKIEL